MNICLGTVRLDTCKIIGRTSQGSFAFSPDSYEEKDGVIKFCASSGQCFLVNWRQIESGPASTEETADWLEANVLPCI